MRLTRSANSGRRAGRTWRLSPRIRRLCQPSARVDSVPGSSVFDFVEKVSQVWRVVDVDAVSCLSSMRYLPFHVNSAMFDTLQFFLAKLDSTASHHRGD